MQSQPTLRRPFSFPKESITQKKLDSDVDYVELFRDSIIKCQTITPDNRNSIVPLFDNDEYDKILDMFPKPEDDMFVILIRQMNKTATRSPLDQVVIELFKYAIVHNDAELIRKLISKTNGTDLFIFGSFSFKCSTPLLSEHNISNMSDLIYDIILADMHLTDSISEIFLDFICKSNNVILLKKFISSGYKLAKDNILEAINNNAIDTIKDIIAYDYNVQQIFNEVDIKIMKMSVEILLTLLACNIDITSQINNILIYAVESNKLDLVTYCVENNTDCDLDTALKFSCRYMHLDIMVYLLQSGADINVITFNDVYCTNSEMMKLLVKYGLQITVTELNYIFAECFVYEKDIANTTFLIDLGADPNWIFERELRTQQSPNYDFSSVCSYNPKFYHALNSYLELFVSMERIAHINFLAEIDPETMRSESNRLFIIACANGSIEMMEYFLNLGADIKYENNLALITACYFGHLTVVEYLLHHIDLNNITENLLSIILYGNVERNNHQNRRYNIYNTLVNTHIFRNDLYNYGNDADNIFELLVRHNVKIPSYDFLDILPRIHYTKEFVSLLLLHGYEINSTFNMDCYRSGIILNVHATNVTILEVCIRLGKTDIVKLLLDSGVDLSITVSSTNFNNVSNNTSVLKLMDSITSKENLSTNNSLLDLAEQLHNTEIKNLLLEYGAV